MFSSSIFCLVLGEIALVLLSGGIVRLTGEGVSVVIGFFFFNNSSLARKWHQAKRFLLMHRERF